MSWTKGVTLTVDHTKIGSTLTHFVLRWAGTLADLKTVANGGSVTSSSGYDIVPYSDASHSTALTFKRVYWDGSTGAFCFDIQITPTSGADYLVYVGIGNSAITTEQGSASTYDTSIFAGRFNLGDGSTLDLTDATSNGFDLTNIGTTTATAGPTGGGGAASFNGSSQQLRRTASALVTSDPIAFSCVFNPSSAADAVLVGQNHQSAVGFFYEMNIRSAAHSTKLRTTTEGTFAESAGAYTVAGWNYGMSVAASVGSRTVYLNGAAGTTDTTTGTHDTVDAFTIGGRYANSSASNWFPGAIGCVSVFLVDPGADWAAAEDYMLRQGTLFSASSPYPIGGASTVSDYYRRRQQEYQ